ncbi:hypothetical protein D3C87_1267390 [compost metagenome]
MVTLNAPDQLLQGTHIGMPLCRLIAMLEVRQQQYFAPGLLDKPQHALRQELAKQRLIQHLLDTLAGQPGLGPSFLGITNALLEQLAATALVLGKREKVGQQFGKYRGVIDKVIQQTLYDLIDAHVQAVTLMIVTGVPTHCRAGDFVEQASCRMTAATEETLVEHRHLDQWNLQSADQRLERIRQIAIIEHAFEQHGDQVDHIFIGLPENPRPATFDADPGE